MSKTITTTKTTKSQKPRKSAGKKAQKTVTVKVKKNPRRRNNNRGGRSLTGKGNTKTSSVNNRTKVSCVFPGDELISNVVGSIPFATTQFPINPGQAGTFPRMAKEAKLWERYQFEMLEFYYTRTSSEFAASATTGKVLLSVDFNAADPPPGSKQEVEDTFPHSDGMPCENFRMPVSPAQLHPRGEPLYVRAAGLPGHTDIKTYDAGSLFLSREGTPDSTSKVGELRVRYRVKFTVPVLENDLAAPMNFSMSQFTTNADEPLTSTVPLFVIFDQINPPNGLLVIDNGGGAYQLPPGNYQVWTELEFVATGGVFTRIEVDVSDNIPVTISQQTFAFLAAAGVSAFSVSSAPTLFRANIDPATSAPPVINISVLATFTGTASVSGRLYFVAI